MSDTTLTRKRNWFERQSIASKMRVIICFFLGLSLIIATAAWVAVSRIQHNAERLARLNGSALLVSDAGGNIAAAVREVTF
jgi:methyl-accepting chemotaxis protein